MGYIDGDSLGFISTVLRRFTASRMTQLDAITDARASGLGNLASLNGKVAASNWQDSGIVTVAAGVNTEGSWYQMIDSTDQETAFALIGGDVGSAAHILDFAVADSGQENSGIVIENLVLPEGDYNVQGIWIKIPWRIASGKRIAVRVQSPHPGDRRVRILVGG